MRVRHAAVIALLVPTWAWAGFLSGNGLKQRCSDESVECAAYIMGISDAHDYYVHFGGISNFCAPMEVTNGQMKAITEKYMEEHPEKLHFAASDIVLNALAEAFPCKQ